MAEHCNKRAHGIISTKFRSLLTTEIEREREYEGVEKRREQPLRKKKTYSENLFPKVVCSLRSASLKMMVQRKKVKWLTGEKGLWGTNTPWDECWEISLPLGIRWLHSAALLVRFRITA